MLPGSTSTPDSFSLMAYCIGQQSRISSRTKSARGAFYRTTEEFSLALLVVFRVIVRTLKRFVSSKSYMHPIPCRPVGYQVAGRGLYYYLAGT